MNGINYFTTVSEFIKVQLDNKRQIQAELIQDLGKIAHSPNELGFLAGQVYAIAEDIRMLEYSLQQIEQSIDENF